MIQNVKAFDGIIQVADATTPLWIDIGDIVRTAYGFPIEVQQSLEVLDQYVTERLMVSNPFRRLPKYLTTLLAGAAAAAEKGVPLGIEGSAVPPELLVELHRIGFRRFSVAVGKRDELRFLLGRSRKE